MVVMATDEKKFGPAQVGTTPVADSPHKRPANTDPRVDGPYLDDVRSEQENAYRTLQNMDDEERREFGEVYRTSAKRGTVVTTDEFINRDTRELSQDEVKQVPEPIGPTPEAFDTNVPGKTETKTAPVKSESKK